MGSISAFRGIACVEGKPTTGTFRGTAEFIGRAGGRPVGGVMVVGDGTGLVIGKGAVLPGGSPKGAPTFGSRKPEGGVTVWEGNPIPPFVGDAIGEAPVVGSGGAAKPLCGRRTKCLLLLRLSWFPIVSAPERTFGCR